MHLQLPDPQAADINYNSIAISEKKINPFNDSVLFIGRRQTVQNQTRRHRTRRLIRISIVCLQNILFKLEYK